MKNVFTLLLSLSSLIGAFGDDDARKATGNADANNPELRGELLQRMKVDQDARAALVRWQIKQGLVGDILIRSLSPDQKAELERLVAAMDTADRENTDWLKKVTKTGGWPTRSLVGSDGASAAWLLVQHADADPNFQRTCLDLMVKLPRDEVSPANVAYLTDRVFLAEGKKQVYGTQFIFADGKLQPRPLEDEGAVDKRRADVGLPPIAQYVKEGEILYGLSPK